MLIAALCLQASLLTHPLYLEEPKPELRSALHILILHDDIVGVPFHVGRNREQALEMMQGLRDRIAAGEDFGEVARNYSEARTSISNGNLGSYPKGMLKEPVNGFLFNAAVGDMSDVLDSKGGVHLIKRVETHAAVLQIQLPRSSSESLALAQRLIQELEGGADFGELAREHSVDPVSASHAGRYRVFERGSQDALIKKAAFNAKVGELLSPIESPIGLHIVKRVSTEGFEQELWDDNFIRVRAILVSHLKAIGASPDLNRTQSEAMVLAKEVIYRLDKGEDFAEIAGRFNDDPGGKERRGDIGWIHRQNPDLPAFFSGLFLAEPGTVSEAILTSAGIVVARRER